MRAPHTVFSTRLRGSRRTAKARLRGIFTPGRPGFVPLILTLAAVALVAGLVACTASPPAEETVPVPSGSPSAAPLYDGETAIPDDALTELLAQSYSQGIQEGDTWELLCSYPGDGCTLGVLRYRSGVHAGGLGSLIFGVFDNATRTPTAPVTQIGADTSDLNAWESDSDGILRLLYTAWTEYQGFQSCTAGLFTFNGKSLIPAHTLPDAAKTSGVVLPEGADSMLDLSANADFWADRKAVIQGAGLTVFRRGPWKSDAGGYQPRWELEFILPLEEDYSPLPLIADARQYFQDLFAAHGMWDSSDLPMNSFAYDIDYQDPTWPEAQVCSAALYDSSTGRWLERIFLYDEDGNRLGVRSSLDYSLRFDGVRHRLGEEELGLFGTPSATNYTDAGDGTFFYSEWFGSDYASGCDYLYQPETGTYSLVNITTNRLDASTNTGIHVGSTVGEALDLYPDIALERNCLTLEESILGPNGCRLTLYYSYGSDPEEPLEITRTRTITRICVSAPTWPGT